MRKDFYYLWELQYREMIGTTNRFLCFPPDGQARNSLMKSFYHYNDVIMTTVASQITSLTVVYSIVYSGADQRKHQSSASRVFVRGFHQDRWIPRTKGPVTRKMVPFDDVIMASGNVKGQNYHRHLKISSNSRAFVVFTGSNLDVGDHEEYNPQQSRFGKWDNHNIEGPQSRSSEEIY